MRTTQQYGIAILILFATSPVLADNPYIIGVGIAADSADAYDVSALVDYAISDATSINMDIGLTEAKADPSDFRAHNWNAALRHEFKHVGVQASLGQRGDRDEFISDNWSIGLFRELNSWQVETSYIRRDFDLTFRSNSSPDRKTNATVAADGYKLSLSYSADSGAGLHATAKKFSYNRDVTRLGQFQIARLLSPSALTLSSSLLDHSVTASGAWPVGEQLLSVGIARDRTAVDKSDVDSVTFSWLTPVGKRCDLDIGVGLSRDTIDTQYFVRFLFLVYAGFE